MSDDTKVCISCNEEKDVEEFYLRPGRKARRAVCRECINEEQLTRYSSNRAGYASRSRARQRALVALRDRHVEEFQAIFDDELAKEES